AIESPRSRSELVLASIVVLGAVTRAFEPLRLDAEWDAAAQVHAALVQAHHALGGDALGLVVDDALHLRGVWHDVEASLSVVQGLVLRLDEALDVVELPGGDQ